MGGVVYANMILTCIAYVVFNYHFCSLTEGRRNNRHNMTSHTLYFIRHKKILARLTSDIGDKLSDFRETIGLWRPFRHYSIGLR